MLDQSTERPRVRYISPGANWVMVAVRKESRLSTNLRDWWNRTIYCVARVNLENAIVTPDKISLVTFHLGCVFYAKAKK